MAFKRKLTIKIYDNRKVSFKDYITSLRKQKRKKIY